MKRLFTFGCSFTSFNWTTWADILGREAEEFQNWGRTGGGNEFVFNSVYECHHRNHFAPGDTVIVCWTNIMREDIYFHGWRNLGNMFTQTLIPQEYVRTYMEERGCLIRDLPMIAATRLLLQTTGVDWKFISMVPISQPDQYSEISLYDEQFRIYAEVISDIRPSFWEVLQDRKPLQIDPHPTPAEHLIYLDQVLPEYTVSQSNRLKVAKEDATIRQPGYVMKPYKNTTVYRS